MKNEFLNSKNIGLFSPINNLVRSLFCMMVILALGSGRTVAQSCSGTWATGAVGYGTNYDCMAAGTTVWVGSTNPNSDPTCSTTPTYTTAQSSTFNFTSPVGGFTIDFSAFSEVSTAGCAKIEIKINGTHYNLTSANIAALPSVSGVSCTGYNTVYATAQGYLTSNTTGGLSVQGRITIFGVNASSVTISTNDGAGSLFTSPYSCGSVVPIKLVSFSGYPLGACNAVLNWETGEESNVKNIELLRSEDGVEFVKVATMNPKGDNSTYSVEADNPNDAYFKLQTNDLDGNSEYSETIKVKANCNKMLYQVIPNPAASSITVTGLKKDDKANIFDMQGRLALSFKATQNNDKINIQKLTPGIYKLQIISNGMAQSNINTIYKY